MRKQKQKIDESKLLFSNHDLKVLLIPLMVEQLLNSLMGTVDSMMVSNVGSAAISAVSLVDSINVLVIQVFTALTAGGAIICSQYLGRKDVKACNKAARQVLLAMLVISIGLMAVCIVFRHPLLRLIFGNVEQDVMDNSQIYFLITALSFPFIGLFDANAAFFRAEGNSKLPMTISALCNLANIAGNAILIFGFNMGVAGAAISTLVSRILMSIIMICRQRVPKQEIVIRDYFSIRPDMKLILIILSVGIPSGIENGMFQFGKLAIQSTVSTLGTIAIAAQAMTNILENLNGIAAIGIGIGMMTVVGQCLGAGRPDEARYYIKKLSFAAEFVVFGSCLLIFLMAGPITKLAGLSGESASLCLFMNSWITIVKPLVWTTAFIPGYGLRAAGDVKFSMILSCLSMWICRVSLCIYLIRVCGFGPIAVWIGMFTDWTVRGLFFIHRFRSGKWLNHQVTD